MTGMEGEKKIDVVAVRKMLNALTLKEIKLQIRELKNEGINLKTYDYKTKKACIDNVITRCKKYNESKEKRRRSKRNMNRASEAVLSLVLVCSIYFLARKTQLIKDDPVAEKVESTIKNVKTIMNRIFQALGIEKIKLEDIKQKLKEKID